MLRNLQAEAGRVREHMKRKNTGSRLGSKVEVSVSKTKNGYFGCSNENLERIAEIEIQTETELQIMTTASIAMAECDVAVNLLGKF